MCQPGEIYATFGEDELRITKKMIEKSEIETYGHLVKYLQKHYDLPCELELYDEAKKVLLTEKSTLFPEGTYLSIKVLFKHIRNVNTNETPIKGLPYDEFFKQRDIKLETGLFEDVLFEKCLQKLKCDGKLSPEIIQDFKRAVWHTLQKNEASKSTLIKKVLEIAVAEDPFVVLQEQYEIKVTKHRVKADRAALQTVTERVICICEDKFSEKDLEEGVVQCFDQMRTYSLTTEGKKFPLIYGIASNFNEWRFLCYHPPEPGTPTTYSNFYVSELFTLMRKNFKIKDKEATQELINIDQKVETLVGMIQVLFYADVDIGVIDTYFLKKKQNCLNFLGWG